MGFIADFRKFAFKGNVIDLAVGVIIGAAFGKIVTSLVDDIITPLILKPVLERANLTNLEELTVFGTVKYGVFLSALIYFVIIAFILFLVIRGVNKMKTREEAAAASSGPSSTDKLLMEIRDELKKKP